MQNSSIASRIRTCVNSYARPPDPWPKGICPRRVWPAQRRFAQWSLPSLTRTWNAPLDLTPCTCSKTHLRHSCSSSGVLVHRLRPGHQLHTRTVRHLRPGGRKARCCWPERGRRCWRWMETRYMWLVADMEGRGEGLTVQSMTHRRYPIPVYWGPAAPPSPTSNRT